MTVPFTYAQKVDFSWRVDKTDSPRPGMHMRIIKMIGTIKIEHSYVFILPDLHMLPGLSSYNKIAYGVKSSLNVRIRMCVYMHWVLLNLFGVKYSH